MKTMAVMKRAAVVVLGFALTAQAQSLPGQVQSHQKIGVEQADLLGVSSAPLGDLDGDGVIDLAVGANNHDGNGDGRGAVWILFLEDDGSVASQQLIAQGEGGFTGQLDAQDRFGASLAGIGDMDGDDVPDLVVGAPGDDDGQEDAGAVWVLFLNTDGTVKDHRKVSLEHGGMPAVLDEQDAFGTGLAAIGDLNHDGLNDIAVGAVGDDDGPKKLSDDTGAVWLICLSPDGIVRGLQKISKMAGNFSDDNLNAHDAFGTGIAGLGDLDGDGHLDICVGAPGYGKGRGAVWILYLKDDGSVRQQTRIAGKQVGALVGASPSFGAEVESVGDLDKNGTTDIAVGVPGFDDTGAVFTLFLEGGWIRRVGAITAQQASFPASLDEGDAFGDSISYLGDLDGDDIGDVAVGASGDAGSSGAGGAVYTLFLDAAVWTDLGHALQGLTSDRIPALSGVGSLVPGEMTRVNLTGALEGAMVFFVVGFNELYMAGFGGIVVPDPTGVGIVLFEASGDDGSLTLAGGWPAGAPSDFELYFQAWIQDPDGPEGLTASNGLSLRTP